MPTPVIRGSVAPARQRQNLAIQRLSDTRRMSDSLGQAMAAVLERRQLLAHQRAHRLIAGDGSVRGFLVPRLRFAAVGEVAEPLIQRASARIDLLHAEFGPVKTPGADALLRGLDEDRADT